MIKSIREKLPTVNFPNIKNWLIWVGGGNSKVINSTARDSEAIFIGIGGIVVSVTAIGIGSSTIAAHTVFESFSYTYVPEALQPLAWGLTLAVGIVYGMLIFFLGRVTISTCPSLDELFSGNRKTIVAFSLMIIVRLVIAIAMAHQITTLLGIALARVEIYENAKSSWIERQLALQKKTDELWTKSIEDADKSIKSAASQMQNYLGQLNGGGTS